MSWRWPVALRGAVALGIVAYPAIAIWSSSKPEWRLLASALAWSPLALAGLWMLWRSRARRWLAPLLLAGVLLLWALRAELLAHYAWAYLVEHAGSLIVFGLVFGSTLRSGQTPLITRFAAMVRKSVSPAVARYTRGVTWAWTLFFGVMALASIFLFLTVSLADWALFASVWTPALVVAMFIAEYAMRCRILDRGDHSGPYEAVRAYLLYRNEAASAPSTTTQSRGTTAPSIGATPSEVGR